MSDPVVIDDPDDPRIADYVDLTDAELRRRAEDGAGVFIVEGALTAAALVTSPYAARSALVTPPQLARHRSLLDQLHAPLYVASQEVMNRTTGFNIHRGVLVAASRRPHPPVDQIIGAGPLLAAAEGLNDQENMGALFRNGRALGVSGLLLAPNCCDPLYRRTVRVSMGHVLHVPHAVLEPWPAGLERIRDAGFALLALTPTEGATPLDDIPRRGRWCVLVGAEGPGLAPATLAMADVRVRIPMAAGVDSLNVATAAAVAFQHLRTTV